MRPRAELALALVALLALGMGAALLGSRKRPAESTDPRRSTFVTSPDGARALAEALTRLGVRRLADPAPARSTAIEPRDGSASGMPRTLLAFLVSVGAAQRLRGAATRGAGASRRRSPAGGPDGRRCHLLLRLVCPPAARLAGRRHHLGDPCPPAASRFRCRRFGRDPARGQLRGAGNPRRHPARHRRWPRRCAPPQDGERCQRDARGRRRTLQQPRPPRDESGEFALGLVAGRYPRVVFDEYHHGFGPSGSLAGAVWAWSLRSPWGWAAWQLLLRDALALAASAIRFGPAHRVIERRRRSALEHVRPSPTRWPRRAGTTWPSPRRSGGSVAGSRAAAQPGAVPCPPGSTSWPPMSERRGPAPPWRHCARSPRARSRRMPCSGRPMPWRMCGTNSSRDHRGRGPGRRAGRGDRGPAAPRRGAGTGRRDPRLAGRARGPRPRAARRRSRHGQDAPGADAQPGPRPGVPPHPVHAGSHAVRHHRHQSPDGAEPVLLPAGSHLRRPRAG